MNNTEFLIGFEAEKCIQCHACEVACKTWRGLGYGVQYRRVLNIWQGKYPRIKSVSLSLACLHCVEPSCVAACPEKAVSKRAQDGRVLVDATLCSGCGICSDVCDFGVPQFGDDGVMQKCDLCYDLRLAGAVPPCVETCPGKALSIIEVSQAEKRRLEESISRLLHS